MKLLSDSIEDFIKALLVDDEDEAQASEVELRRNELAEHFQCAPSQINYVLATRFTPEHGYVIESRRGGGGYIRIMRLAATSREELLQTLYQRIGTSISSVEAAKIIETLKTEKIVTEDEACLMHAALNPTAVPLPLQMKDALAAGTLRSMLLTIAKRRTYAEGERSRP
ncbi:MAG: CtsR family transcriptional regulator [Clostridia bacterium]|nr:CtsR family transcriptional regulator [Clostridia bacterium]